MHRMTKPLCVLLALCLMFASCAGAFALAADTVTGVVVGIDSGSKLYVRSSTVIYSDTRNVLDKLVNDDKVTVLETLVVDGRKWYKVTTERGKTGYCVAQYVSVETVYTPDEKFEAELTAQGFPEDYKPALRKLHADHPSWVFKADKLSMTWEAALAGESKVGLNTVKSPDAWKSMEKGAYDWATGTYVAFDSGGWVAASSAVVAHYLDPRNFLNDNYIFQYEDLSFSADQTVDGVKRILPAVLADIAPYLIQYGKEYNVSAYFLAAKIVQEGTVSNKLALGQVAGYEGYYNFFDIGAYAHDGNGAVTNGAIYAKNHGWNTPEKCINDTVQNNFANSYIGRGQNTTFYQKFNLHDTDPKRYYTHQYMSNVSGAAGEGKVMVGKMTEDSLACAHTFCIPVYKNMPAAAAPRPAETGNNNNFLDSITVGDCALTPTFDRYTMSYAVQVDKDVASIAVSAKKNADAATLTGGGTVALKSGENTVKLTVKATSGAVRTYTVTITREPGGTEPPAGEDPVPTVTGKAYTVHADTKTVTGVEPGAQAAEFLKALEVKDGTAKLTAADGKEKTSGAVGTGDILQLFSGDKQTASYAVVIYGDVNGDGLVNSMDLRVGQKHILRIGEITGYYLTAADSNRDGTLNSMDLRTTQKFILKLTKTLQ